VLVAGLRRELSTMIIIIIISTHAFRVGADVAP
jgi:hypothetical protein